MDWYYAVGGERFGPFDQATFDQLVAQGRVTGVTLVWREGLDDWIQYQLLAGSSDDQTGAIPPVMGQCSQCSRRTVRDDMVQYQGHWICAECKNTFFQRVREGGVVMAQTSGRQYLRFAGFWIRFGAYILDGLILFVANMAIGMIVGVVQSSSRFDYEVVMWTQLVVSLIQLGIFLTYTTWFLGKFGATPGKMACGLKVRLSNGRPISYARAFGRAWSLILSLVISYIALAVVVFIAAFGIAGVAGPRPSSGSIGLVVILSIIGGLFSLFPFYMAGMTKQKCALHDFICNTRVIHER